MNELKKGKRADRVRAVIPYVGLLLVVLIFGVWSKGELFDGRNLIPVFNNCFNIMFAAIGLTFVLSQGSLDLSIGGVVTFCGILGAFAANVNPYLLLPVTLSLGLLLGFVNGFIAAKLHVNGFIATLAMGNVLTGLSVIILYSSGIGIPLEMLSWSTTSMRVAVLCVAFLAGFIILEFMPFGRRLRAVGASSIAADYAGVSSTKYQWIGYTITGAMSGLLAFFIVIRSGSATSAMGGTLQFDALIALLIGGFPLQGGTNSHARSALIGSLTLSILVFGMTLCRVDTTALQLVKGLLFLFVVVLTFDRESTPVIK